MKTSVLFRTCSGLPRFDNPELSNGNSPLSSTSTSKRNGGFTCCVPGCFANNKRNPELYFHNFPSGNIVKSKEHRKNCINFSPTTGHRVCSLHFPGGRKSCINHAAAICE